MPENLEKLLILIPSLPLAGAIITAALGFVLKKHAHWPVVLGIVGSAIASLALLNQVSELSKSSQMAVGWESTVDLWNWVQIDGAIATPAGAKAVDPDPASAIMPDTLPFKIDVTLRADALTAIMLATVTFVASLVAIYASGYMHGDRGYWRFFAYVGLFVFSMTMLVSVSNFVLLYVFWEAVGLCSYLLVGFWYEKPEAVAAGKKAFLVNRVGDFGFAIALFLIWTTYGTLNFHDSGGVAGIFGQTRLVHPELYVTGGVATAICLLLMIGACGKSAQFPLHVWLPDAMEGPTPVSALIHAATMVTSGIYMITRCTPLFVASPDAQKVVAVIGSITVLIGGIIACTQTDLKRVLAYSTISQLGYMFLGLGVGTLSGITAGMFHLFTHAFFKALLFLGAGSVMHAMGGVIDMRRFSGLRHRMPITHWTFLFGCLALAAVVPFAGFWSKDEIVAAAHARAATEPIFEYLYWNGLFVAFLTAVYTFRGYFLTFHGPEKIPYEAGDHAHESPNSMVLPLVVLAIASASVGAYFALSGSFADLLARTPSLAYEPMHAAVDEHGGGSHLTIAVISTVIALSGIGLAAYLYLGDRKQADGLVRVLRPLYVLSYGKLFFDPIYQVLFVWPLWLLAQASYWFDRTFIDGIVNLVGRVPPWVARGLRSLQTGMAQFYALAMVWGVLVLVLTLLVWPALGALGNSRKRFLLDSMQTLLVATIFMPVAGALLIGLMAPSGQVAVRQSALVTSLVTLGMTAVLLVNYAPAGGVFAEYNFAWLERSSNVDVQFSVGLDGLSLWLFGLSALLLVTCVLVSWNEIVDRPAVYYALLLLLGSGMLGVFAARDIILFYIFFEFTLIPLFFLIGVWGHEDRHYAAAKFFLYTLAGSVLTFLGLLSIVLWDYNHNELGLMTFSIPALTAGLAANPIAAPYQLWIFLALFAGFAIKVPLFPLHTWLPLAHTQAPTAGSVVLAGVLLKIGTYGFVRFNLPMLPEATATCVPWLLGLSVVGILYGALVALVQTDMKRLIAYSSVSHLGFCMLGLFALTGISVEGGVLQMINHGLSTGGLFALVGMVYERYHTREIHKLSGLTRQTPVLAFFFVLFTLSSIGLPGLNGFAGEFLILLGMFERAWTEAPAALVLAYQVMAVAAVFGVVLGAWYMLWLVQRVFFGPLKEGDAAHEGHAVRDLSLREIAALVPLVVFVFWIGLHPQFFLERMRPSLDALAKQATLQLNATVGTAAPTPPIADAPPTAPHEVAQARRTP